MTKQTKPQADAIALDCSDSEKAVDYYESGHTQHEGGEWRKPAWVPSKVRLSKWVRGDWPFSNVEAAPGDYECRSNRNGAVSVSAGNGQWLGLMLDEFEILEWRENQQCNQ
jgi:hypothetical protein